MDMNHVHAVSLDVCLAFAIITSLFGCIQPNHTFVIEQHQQKLCLKDEKYSKKKDKLISLDNLKATLY